MIKKSIKYCKLRNDKKWYCKLRNAEGSLREGAGKKKKKSDRLEYSYMHCYGNTYKQNSSMEVLLLISILAFGNCL